MPFLTLFFNEGLCRLFLFRMFLFFTKTHSAIFCFTYLCVYYQLASLLEHMLWESTDIIVLVTPNIVPTVEKAHSKCSVKTLLNNAWIIK